LLHAVATQLLALESASLLAFGYARLLTLKAASLLSRLLAFETSRLLARLVALETASLLPSLLTFEATRLLPRLLAFEPACLLTFDALLPWRRIAATMATTTAAHEGKAATTVAATAAAEDRSSETATAAMAVTTAAAFEYCLAAATAVTAAAAATALFSLRRPATAIAMAASVAARLRCSRARDRQSGDSRGEKQPGHRKFSFRTVRTARSPHRSNALTDGTCGLAHQDEPEISSLFR
jgi:hypothetical protein